MDLFPVENYDFDMFARKSQVKEEEKKKEPEPKLLEEKTGREYIDGYIRNIPVVVKVIALCVVFASLIGMRLMEDAKLAALKYENKALVAEYKQEEVRAATLNTELQKVYSVEKIIEFAKDKLFMSVAQDSQLVFLNLSDGDEVSFYKE